MTTEPTEPEPTERLRVWIDTKTGTWGLGRPDLMVVDLDIQAIIDSEGGMKDHDGHSLLAAMESMDDGEVIAFANSTSPAARSLIAWLELGVETALPGVERRLAQ